MTSHIAGGVELILKKRITIYIYLNKCIMRKIDREQVIEDLEDIQTIIDGMGFCGSNEKELWTREAIADYMVKEFNAYGFNKRSEPIKCPRCYSEGVQTHFGCSTCGKCHFTF